MTQHEAAPGIPSRYIHDVHDMEPVTWKESLLGNALAHVLVTAGVLNSDMVFTGPELLMAAEGFAGGAVADLIRAEVRPCLDHPMPYPKPTCWTCGRNGAFERAARIADSASPRCPDNCTVWPADALRLHAVGCRYEAAGGAS